jgi:hypothetical protein
MSPAGRGIFERQRIEKDQASEIYRWPDLFSTEIIYDRGSRLGLISARGRCSRGVHSGNRYPASWPLPRIVDRNTGWCRLLCMSSLDVRISYCFLSF